MPAKYSHAKKKLGSGPQSRKSISSKTSTGTSNANANNASPRSNTNSGLSAFHRQGGHAHRNPSPHVDRTISQAISAVSELERAISRILLLRYEHDIARLYSTRLHKIALIFLPSLILDCTIASSSPAWAAVNADCDEVKDFFRGAIAMDLRQAGERVATKSVLWSYTALRHFALSNNVSICSKRGLHSLRLLPHFPALKAHLDDLEALPTAAFTKPAHLTSSMEDSIGYLETGLKRKKFKTGATWRDWEKKIRVGYERLTDTLWNVSREFDVRGYGLVLREKLTAKWCDCGCSTDHLGEVCERTVREEEEESGVRSGKGREWDGRGSGVFGWQTEEEEDIWGIGLDFGCVEPSGMTLIDPSLTIGELMEWRYFNAERFKETGNDAFRAQDYEGAITSYTYAFEMEPELPYYQLNIAAAHLKLSNWIAAEKACNTALQQHKSGKGYWRRAKARRMQGRIIEAVKDLRHVLQLQPGNTDALAELLAIMPSAASEFSPDPGEYRNDENLRPMSSGPSGSSSYSSSSSGFRNNNDYDYDYDYNPSNSQASSSRSPIRRHYNNSHGSGGSSSGSRTTTERQGSQSALPLPFETTDADTLKLRIYATPMEMEMPMFLTIFANGRALSPAWKKAPKGTFNVKLHSFSYPTWERCKVTPLVTT